MPAAPLTKTAAVEEVESDVLRCISLLTIRPIGTLGAWFSSPNAISNEIVDMAFYYGDAYAYTPLLTLPMATISPDQLRDLYGSLDNFREKSALAVQW